MTKCGTIDEAIDDLNEAFGGISIAQSTREKLRIVRRAIKQCLEQLNPDYTEEFYQIVDESVEEYPELASALSGWREILNADYSAENWENRQSQVDGEETDESKLFDRARVRREFLNSHFKDSGSKTTAGRAMLYFQRDTNQKLMKTFLVDREAGVLVAKEDIPQRVQEFKLQLLDTIVDYLRDFGYKGSPKLFDENGIYLDVLHSDNLLKTSIEAFLVIGKSFNTQQLKNAYEEFRAETGNWLKSKKFLEAYNAKVLLTNFDEVTKMLLGTIVKPGQTRFGSVSNTTYTTMIHRATKMWGNGFGDDVENIADIVSDITLRLVRTSRKHSWKGGPMKDQYLSFQEFNHIITKVKKLHQESISKKIVFDNTFWDAEGNDINNISTGTKRSLDTIRLLKTEQGYTDNNPTFEDLLSFISDNPQRHLHAIFDLLCNTDIVDRFPKIDTLDKNLIWTVGKELFGSWSNETDDLGNPTTSRSLYDMHSNSDGDRIFEIVTQVADSVFLDQFLQYYEDQEGSLKIRVLLDYAVSLVKNQIMYDMRLTHGMFNPDRFNKFLSKNKIQLTYKDASEIAPINNKKRAWTVDNPDYNPDVPGSKPKLRQKAQFLKKVTIPVGNLMKIEFEDGKLKRFSKSNVFTDSYEAIWKSDVFRQIVKDTIGKDFKTDVELASAYEETFKQQGLNGGIEINYKNLVTDLSLLCGAVVFNLAFNNVVVPTILNNGTRERNKRNVEILRDNQYYGQAIPRINPETGVVEMLADNVKESYLNNLGLAQATIHGLLTSAQVKTAENTAIASQNLSRLLSSYAYQIMTLNKNTTSATRHLTFVNNENGMFRDPVSRREFKSDATVKVNTDTSAVESYLMSFLGITGAFIDAQDSTTINRNGQAYIVPEVSSDKTSQAELPVQLKAESRWQKGKTLRDMTISELETEMCYEFGTMYDTIVKNINKENLRLATLFNIDLDLFKGKPAIVNYRNILSVITDTICDAPTLVHLFEAKSAKNAEIVKKLQEQGKQFSDILKDLEINYGKEIAGLRQKHIVKLMHETMVNYNRTHRRAPILMSELIHYLFDKNGRMVPNDTLRALWGRFKGNEDLNKRYGITDLYPEGKQYASTVEGYFRIKDLRGVEELFTNGFEIFLLGAKSKEKLAEILYLRELFPGWITRSGKMALAKVFFPEKYSIGDRIVHTTGAEVVINNVSINSEGAKSYLVTVTQNGIPETKWCTEGVLDSTINSEKATFIPTANKPGTWKVIDNLETYLKYINDPKTRDNVQIHPMISKVNRITYLADLEYTCSVGGAHYVYKGKGSNVLEEEANRWLASNKRNVCYASTVHKYQNKTLTGPPKIYQIAPIEDIKSVIYSIMGDMDSHKPIDGGMFVLPWLAELENNALGGEAAGIDKKQFGTYYYEDIAAGGIIKTAGFALTNQRMLRSEAYRNLCKNMTDRIWLKEYAAADGSDIEEYLDITRDYKGNTINWVLDGSGQRTFYLKDTPGGGCLRYSLANIEAIYTNGTEERTFQGPIPMGWTPTNKYKIYEYPVTNKGEVDTRHPEIARLLADTTNKDLSPILRTDEVHPDGVYTIRSNWDLYTQVFGGYNSLSLNNDGNLQPSEHSISLMVYALNNIGYKRDTEHNDPKFGDKKYTTEQIDKIDTLDDLWQPLKYSDILYAPNIGALKSTQMNVNPSEGMYKETYLNAMNIMMALLGIQLDKEHHADNAEVSMPTQIIQACANKGYTIEYSSQLYKSLSTLTEIAIEDCMKGVMELMPGNENKGTLLTEIANIIVDKLIHTLDDNAALDAVFEHLIKKAQDGKKLTPEDLAENPIPWSDAKLYNKVYNDIASHLTNNAIKMKFPGTLAVICPTERVERMYGNRRLNQFADPEHNISEILGKELYQERVRNGFEKGLIYNSAIHSNDTYEKLSLASNLDTLHHYWVEYTYADGSPVIDEKGQIYKESYTIESPKDYFKLRDLIAYGGEGNINLKTMAGEPISRENIRVSMVYENVMEGRELGAYNVRFRTLEANQQFNIFDLSSVQALFDYNDLEKTLDNAITILDDERFIDRKYAVTKILEHMYKKAPKSAKLLEETMKIYPDLDITQAVTTINETAVKDFILSTFDICKGITYKLFELDLFKISSDYKGDRLVYINNTLMTVNPDTILTLAYELIMPKVYQTKFGLQEQDQVLEILTDKDFFTKRAISKVRELKVDPSCFHYELKNFNGKHVYIWDSSLGEPDPEKFQNKTFYPVEVSTGKYERRDIDGNFMHELSSKKDKIMKVGDLGYEIIVTNNPAFYMEHLNYNLATFSEETVEEQNLKDLVELLSISDSKKAKQFINTFTTKKGELRDFKALCRRNDFINAFTLDVEDNEPIEISNLRRRFIKEGDELYASFDKSLDIIAGRIPAQSLQSFMPQRVVAFDNNDINTAYVSTFLLFLQGSDLDIDAVTLLGSEFDDNGKYVMWSPLADISSKEKLAASQHLPFPTGFELGVETNNKKDSWFKTYDSYIEELFETETDVEPLEDGTTKIVPLLGKDGSPVLKLKTLTPERIKVLAEFLRKVNEEGLNIKGDLNSDGKWKLNQALIDEWIGARKLDDGIVLETPNALKLLGFKQLHDMSSALQLISKLINKHNLYIRTADGPTREKMAKNMCLWTMYQVCSTASNLTELMTGVDLATWVLKGKGQAVDSSPWSGDDAHVAPGNYFSIHSSFQTGLVGKQCVGIGAVSIKVNSTTQYYMDTLLREGSEEDKQRLLFPKVDKWGRHSAKGERAYFIGGKKYYGLANLYDKNSETAELREIDHPSGVKINLKMAENSDDIIRLLASILTEVDITPNVAMSLAAMLSVAVDNAKDLALAKINAGPKMFGFYAYGISLGIDIRDLAKIINTPQGRAISKICEGNVVNGQMGAFSALQAIKKLEGENIYGDLTLFDLTGILDSDSPNQVSAGVVFDNKVKKTASEVIQVLMLDYYTKNVIKDANLMHLLEMKPNVKRYKGAISTEAKLDNMVYLIAILGKMKECIEYMTSEDNPLWQQTINQSNALLENSLAWQSSLYLLTEYLNQYGDLVSTYYSHSDDDHYYARDLKILGQGAEEMRVLGSILSSNKGVKSRTEEGITFIETIENAVIDRKKVMGLEPSPDDRIDYILFCVDPNYRKEAIEKYEEVKHSVNILDVVATAPHFLSYLRACMIPYAAFKVGSAKFRARDKYYRPVVDAMKLTKSSDKENAIRGIEAAVNDRMLREWLTLEQIQFMLPAGGKLFVGRDLDAWTVSEPTPVPLWTVNGLATFKNYMEEEIIPKLRLNPSYSNNSFIHGLTPFELTKTGTHATVTAYTLDGNMMPYTESLVVLMETYRADFEQMFDYAFPGHNSPELRNTIPSYADAFYIYSQYVFGGKKGLRSLMALFDNGECSLAKKFEAYEAQVDTTLDFDFILDDLFKWCAPNSNIYNPSAEYFYATSSTEFGKLFYRKNHEKKSKEEVPDGETPKKSKENEKVVQAEDVLTSLNRQVYINPAVTDSPLIPIAYVTGTNNNIVEYKQFNQVELEKGSNEYWSLVANDITGTYSIQPSGPISERAQKILNLANTHLEFALVSVPLLKTGIYMQGINPRALNSLIEEAINEIDNNCK